MEVPGRLTPGVAMVHTDATDVLVAGAGPVGLTAAAALRQQGIACRIVDRLPAGLLESLVVLGDAATPDGATPGPAAGATPDAAPGPAPVYRDAQGEFGRIYAARHCTAFLVRPDGYLGARLSSPAPEDLAASLAPVFRR
jgi:2-polyprenyl-6-methoxyphenol hydroxylase-like FAD-dependent oxidoreductase